MKETSRSWEDGAFIICMESAVEGESMVDEWMCGCVDVSVDGLIGLVEASKFALVSMD